MLAIHTLQARLEANERAADSLRSQLEESRAAADRRVEAVRSAGEALVHQLRTEVNAATEAQRAAEEIAHTKDALITGLQTHPVIEPVPVIVAAKTDDHVALVRHEETLREVKGTSSELARMSSMQADLRHLVIDARQHDQKRAALAAERADREALAQRLQVGTAVLSLLQFALILLMTMHRRKR